MSVISLNENNFEEEVLKSEKPVLIDFWASWCGPCKMMSPVIDKIAEEMGDTVKVCKINIDEEAYGNTSFDSSNIDFVPILDSEVEDSIDNIIKITFRVGGARDNSDVDDIIYDVALSDLNISCDLLSPYLKWKLVKGDEEIASGSLDYKFDTIKNGRLVLTETQEDLAEYSESGSGYDDYTFYMWLSDSCQDELGKCDSKEELVDQSNLLNKRIGGKIEIEVNSGNKKKLERKPSSTLDKSVCVEE